MFQRKLAGNHSQQPVPDRFTQFRVGFTGCIKAGRRELVKSEHTDANGSSSFCQPLSPGACLQGSGDADANFSL